MAAETLALFCGVNDALSVLHKSKFFKSRDSGLFRAQGGFSALIRGLLKLINRQSSFDQRMERQTWEEGEAARRMNQRKRPHL